MEIQLSLGRLDPVKAECWSFTVNMRSYGAIPAFLGFLRSKVAVKSAEHTLSFVANTEKGCGPIQMNNGNLILSASFFFNPQLQTNQSPFGVQRFRGLD